MIDCLIPIEELGFDLDKEAYFLTATIVESRTEEGPLMWELLGFDNPWVLPYELAAIVETYVD